MRTEQNASGKVKLSDGIIKQNMVLMSGLFAGPVIGASTTLENSLIVAFAFTLITAVSVGLCRLLPKKLAFAIRIALYALIASLVYIPVTLLSGVIFGADKVSAISLYIAIIVTNPMIMSKTESRFFLRSVPMMLKDLAGFIIGFDLSCILVGVLRDILTDNLLWNTIIPLPFQMSAMESVYGGFILVGVLAGFFRFVYRKVLGRRKKGTDKRNGAVSIYGQD